MKARVKATGEIVEITSGVICIDKNGYKQTIHSDFIEPYVDINPDNDYWEKLKHQYAGMAMQGILSNNNLLVFLCKGHEKPISKLVLDNADILATALVNRLKEDKS